MGGSFWPYAQQFHTDGQKMEESNTTNPQRLCFENEGAKGYGSRKNQVVVTDRGRSVPGDPLGAIPSCKIIVETSRRGIDIVSDRLTVSHHSDQTLAQL